MLIAALSKDEYLVSLAIGNSNGMLSIPFVALFIAKIITMTVNLEEASAVLVQDNQSIVYACILYEIITSKRMVDEIETNGFCSLRSVCCRHISSSAVVHDWNN